MRMVLANDHRGTQLKKRLKELLDQMHIESLDVGTSSADSVDYPDFAASAAKKVSAGEYDRAILICGSGIGMSIVANKFPRVRAALCHDVQAAEMTRRHNDSNILCLGADVLSEDSAQAIVKTWIETEFEGGRHLRRVEKIGDIETQLKRGDD